MRVVSVRGRLRFVKVAVFTDRAGGSLRVMREHWRTQYVQAQDPAWTRGTGQQLSWE